MARIRTPGDGPKCMICGKPAVWSGYCQMEDGHGYCNSVPKQDPAGEAKYVLGGSMSDTTPVEIVNDYLEERGRLYWEMVNKFVETSLDDWKAVKPKIDVLWDLLEKACRAYGLIAFAKPFDAFVVMHHSKHPTAAVYNNMGRQNTLIKHFSKGSLFPWKLMAINAFYCDCNVIVFEKLAEEFDNLGLLPSK